MRPTSMTSLPLKFQLLLMDYEPQCFQAGNLGILGIWGLSPSP